MEEEAFEMGRHLYSLGRWGGQRTSPEFDLKEEVAPPASPPTTSTSLDLQHSALVTTSWPDAGRMKEQEQRPATEEEHEKDQGQK